jgi:hypothetical protein
VFAAVILFKAHTTVVAISSAVIALNVAVVVGGFKWAGWKLGGVEAVSLSILVRRRAPGSVPPSPSLPLPPPIPPTPR